MRPLRPSDRWDCAGGALRELFPRGRPQGRPHRAARRGRDHPAARGVPDDHAPHGGSRLANHGADRGRGGDRGVVPTDLPDREEDRARMDTLKLLVTGFVLAGCSVPAAAQTSLSIYTDGRVVVRRSLPQPLEKGRNTLTLKLDGLDPSTLFSPDTGVGLVTAVLRPASERAPALESALGQTLTFVRGKGDTVRATVVRVSPPQYRLADGRFLLSEPGEPIVPAEVVRTAPEATVTFEAGRARPRTELAYVVHGGARWAATYQVLLTGAKCQVSGSATITSQSLRADSAEVQLVAGSINRAAPEARADFAAPAAPGLAMMAVGGAPTTGHAGGATHPYHLPGPASPPPP